MGDLLFGTSSWSERTWEGVFYPTGTPPGQYLAHYATRFPTVEVDSTYYRIPSRSMVAGWAARTPEGFLLSAKFPRSVVHAGAGERPDAAAVLVRDRVWPDVARFLDAMALLGPKCGPLVLQLPYFNRAAFPSVEPFLERLDAFLAALPSGATFRYGVEVRNRDWVAAPLLEVLRRHRVALVLVDLVYMPHPAETAAHLDLVTTDFVYARLIGDRKAVDALTDRFDRVVIDQAARLARWAELLRALRDRVPRTLVYANNHYAGHGPATIRELERLVDPAIAPPSEPCEDRAPRGQIAFRWG
ncbi:MAG TPA: DUF72 domain-containing protein [Polyangia bacterium]|jgi:uncharacterized protein YecE (DUF72 family)